MYFRSRAEAGKALAQKLDHYKSQHIVVVALGVSSSIVAAQVAMKLHANMLIYVTEGIRLPGEHDAIAAMGSGDIFSYNRAFTSAELDELSTEYHSYIEQERREKVHKLHMLLGADGEIDKALLRHRTVLLVADGLASGAELDVVADFFKTVAIKKLVIITPLATVSAVDRMHLVADEIFCLSTVDNFFGTDHYYEQNNKPDMPGILKIMRNISLNWETPGRA